MRGVKERGPVVTHDYEGWVEEELRVRMGIAKDAKAVAEAVKNGEAKSDNVDADRPEEEVKAMSDISLEAMKKRFHERKTFYGDTDESIWRGPTRRYRPESYIRPPRRR